MRSVFGTKFVCYFPNPALTPVAEFGGRVADLKFQAVAGGEPIPPVHAPGTDRHERVGPDRLSYGLVILYEGLQPSLSIIVKVQFPVIILSDVETVLPGRT